MVRVRTFFLFLALGGALVTYLAVLPGAGAGRGAATFSDGWAEVLPAGAGQDPAAGTNGGNQSTGAGGVPGEAATDSGPPAVGGPIIYVVKQGDTLWSIARRHQLTASAVAAANGLADPDAIKPGQQLRIPSGGEVYHTVQPGETLWQIALRYGLEVDAVANLNRLGDSSFLAVGRQLRLPVAKSLEPDPEGLAARRPAGEPRGFAWPLRGPITSLFGPREGRLHTGIDIAADKGSIIRASKPGVVSVAGWMGGYGLAVVIRHADGTATLYGHASELLVERGSEVEGGQPVARVGSTGNSTGPHLHFEIMVEQHPRDPLSFLPA